MDFEGLVAWRFGGLGALEVGGGGREAMAGKMVGGGLRTTSSELRLHRMFQANLQV